MTGQIGDLKERVTKNEDRLENIYAEVGQLVESKIEEGLRRINLPQRGVFDPAGGTGQDTDTGDSSGATSYASALMSLPGPSDQSRNVPTNRKHDDYTRCRKTLRIRPVGDGLAKELTIKYMLEHLKMDRATVDRLGDFSVVRVPYGPKTRYKDEVLVQFSTVEARDVVRSSATNLAGMGTDFGIRLEVPNHLKAAMRALQAVSYEIKQRHSNSRRNVLYDDDCMELALDFSLGEGHPWKRVTAQQALEKKKKIGQPNRTALGDDELDDILSGEHQRPSNRARRGFGDDEDYQN